MAKNTNHDEAVLITVNEFAARVMLSPARARELVRSSALCNRGIAVNINADGKQGGMRVHWPKYLEYISKTPAVPEHKRVRPRLVI